MSWHVHQKVTKPKGYPYPGTVVAVFETLAGETRLVVESDLAPGMLHIFTPAQLLPVARRSSGGRCGSRRPILSPTR